MKIKCIICIVFLVFSMAAGGTIQAQNEAAGYVISVEGEKVYIDLAVGKVKPGDKVAVYSKEGYFVHPVTKKRLKREPSQVASLEVVKVYTDYSLAKAVPAQSLSKVEVGMSVQCNAMSQSSHSESSSDVYGPPAAKENRPSVLSVDPVRTTDEKVSVFVAPAQVNDVVGVGYFGTYVSDLLMEQLMFCDKVRLLDRTVMGMQMDETDLTGSYIDPNTAIQRGKIAGAQYVVQVTMQKPDVVNVRTGIPLASIMGAFQAGFGKNLGAQYMSNVEVATLTASVSITARVVDLQTGEVLFMSSGTGKAKGKSQLSMEYGALGGAQLNGGADGFKQTVTGQAIQKAFIGIGRNLNQYFNGDAKSRVMGSASGFGNYGDEMKARGFSLYMGTEKISKDDARMLFADHSNLYFRYKSAKSMSNWGWGLIVLGAIGAGSGIFDEYGEFFYIVSPIGGGIMLIGAGLEIASAISIKKIARDYNTMSKQSDYACRLSLVAPATGGLGVRLTF